MIPIILLGKSEDKTLSRVLGQTLNCSRVEDGNISFVQNTEILLIDSPQVTRLDAGGGIVVLKESFCKDCAPRHLLHARCVLAAKSKEAQEFSQDSGLETISCGGSFDTLALSSVGEHTVVTLQTDLKRMDGSIISAGEFLFDLPNDICGQEKLLCAAVLLLVGYA